MATVIWRRMNASDCAGSGRLVNQTRLNQWGEWAGAARNVMVETGFAAGRDTGRGWQLRIV